MDTGTFKAISAAYDKATSRLVAQLVHSCTASYDRYAGQIDVWFDACDLLQIEVLP